MAAWDLWFKEYFEFMQEYPGVKGFCYINNNWHRTYYQGGWWKDSRISQNTTVSSLFASEVAEPVFAKGNDLANGFDSEHGRWLDGAARIVYDSRGSALMILLETGDLLLLKNSYADLLPIDANGQLIGPDSQPLSIISPAAEISVPSGESLLSVLVPNEDDGNLYIAGSFQEDMGATIAADAGENEYIIRGNSGDTLMIVDSSGNLALRGKLRLVEQGRVLTDETFMFQPMLGKYGCCRSGSGVVFECPDCADEPEWCNEAACDYSCQDGDCAFAEALLEMKTAEEDALYTLFENGNMSVSGGIFTSGESIPSGELMPFLVCENEGEGEGVEEGEFEASETSYLVLNTGPDGIVADLWLAGDVIVGLSQEDIEAVSGCAYIWRAPDDSALVSVDETGTLRMSGYLFSGNWPYSRALNFPSLPVQYTLEE